MATASDDYPRSEVEDEQLATARDKERAQRRFRKLHGRDPFSFPVVVKQTIGMIEESDDADKQHPINAAFDLIGQHIINDDTPQLNESVEFEFKMPDENRTFSITVAAS